MSNAFVYIAVGILIVVVGVTFCIAWLIDKTLGDDKEC